MSPLRGRKKKSEAEAEGKRIQAATEEASKAPSVEEPKHEALTPTSWFSKLTTLGDIQSTLNSLPDLDIQLYVGDSLVRFVKKGFDKISIAEERSLRPDVTIRISDRAWTELVKIQSLDEFANLYRKYSKTPSREEFVKVSINKETLLSHPGILRSRLFKDLLLV